MKILFIILDSADQGQLEKWMRAEFLPNLQRLSATSISGCIENRPGVYQIASWRSIATGCQPTKHGRYSWLQYDPNTYVESRPDPDDMKHQTFWQVLEQAGRRVAVIDFPRIPLLDLKRGVQIVDWYPHDFSYGDLHTIPGDLKLYLIKKYGLDPCNGMCDNWPKEKPSDFAKMVDVMHKRISNKVKMFEELWCKDDWDLFTISFGEAHCIGHQCWHIQDDGHDWYDADLANKVKNPVLSIYQSLDSAVGRLLDTVGSETTTILLANPGMERPYHGHFFMGEVLSIINNSMPHGQPSGVFDQEIDTNNVDLKRARMKSFPVLIGNSYFALRVNLVGREAFGMIHRGVELDAYLKELTQELLALHHVEDGQPIFKDPIRTTDCYNTNDDHNMPDLMLRWCRTKPITAIESTLIGRLNRKQSKFRSGDHNPEGRYWIKSVGRCPGDGPNIRDLDIGVTISAMLGESIPDTDGRIIPEWMV